jgi:hypothetical protein
VSQPLHLGCPRIDSVGGRLVARTSWWGYASRLGLYSCEVTADPRRSIVTVSRRFLWLLKTKRRVQFADIRSVAYGYHGRGSSVASRWLSDNDYDCFTVGLRLQDARYLHLFRFRGVGDGTEERLARDYAERLAAMTGAPLGR